MRVGSVCTGYGGLDAAVAYVFGGELAWVADNDPNIAVLLAHRFPGVPNLGDLTAVDWAAVEPVDILCGGFPCTDVSSAGLRLGLRAGTRSGIWANIAVGIAVLAPALVIVENVGGLLSAWADSDMEPCPWCLGDAGTEHALRACGAVLADLAEAGYDAVWTAVRAARAGAPHRRERIFILAWPAANADGAGRAALTGQRDGAGSVGPAGAAAACAGVAERGPGGETTADTAGASGGQRREPAPGQAPGRRARADAGRRNRAPAADPGDRSLAERAWGAGRPEGQRAPVRGIAGEHGGGSTPDAAGSRFAEIARAGSGEGEEPERVYGQRLATPVRWGPYEPAIRRWEHATGRPAPRPTDPGRHGNPRLSERFVEWMMGLGGGWVTAVPGLSRSAKLRALGNGVVPQQAVLAIWELLDLAAYAMSPDSEETRP